MVSTRERFNKRAPSLTFQLHTTFHGYKMGM